MFQRIRIIGRGRLGSALAARLERGGHHLCESEPDVIALCVPDAVIAKVAEAQPPDPGSAT